MNAYEDYSVGKKVTETNGQTKQRKKIFFKEMFMKCKLIKKQ